MNYFPSAFTDVQTPMTLITMKSGKTISVNLTVEAFEKIINDFLA